MKTTTKTAMILLALGISALAANAQSDNDGPPEGRPHGHHRPPPPLVAALDANHDGVIDASEIANAPAALKALDKNGDGQLTRDELMPPRPEGTNNATGGGERRGPGSDGHRPPMPVMTALDANHDGVISADEIANAPTALKALDKNSDGKLTRDELMPPRPAGGSDDSDGPQGGHHHGPGGPGSDGPPPGE